MAAWGAPQAVRGRDAPEIVNCCGTIQGYSGVHAAATSGPLPSRQVTPAAWAAPRTDPLLEVREDLRDLTGKIRIATTVLGDEPVELVAPVLARTLPLPSAPTAVNVPMYVGMALDGVARGTILSRGVFRPALERSLPGLVRRWSPTPGTARLLDVGKRLRTTLRLSAYGLTAAIGVIDAARAVRMTGSMHALAHTQLGRGGALTAAGGTLMLIPHPLTWLAGAAAFAAAAANELGLLDRLGH